MDIFAKMGKLTKWPGLRKRSKRPKSSQKPVPIEVERMAKNGPAGQNCQKWRKGLKGKKKQNAQNFKLCQKSQNTQNGENGQQIQKGPKCQNGLNGKNAQT